MTGARTTLLTQRDLSQSWKLSGRTLERWRSARQGPAWVVIGGSIRYRLEDVLAYEARQRRGAQCGISALGTEGDAT